MGGTWEEAEREEGGMAEEEGHRIQGDAEFRIDIHLMSTTSHEGSGYESVNIFLAFLSFYDVPRRIFCIFLYS